MKEIKTLEKIASILLKFKIGFTYTDNFLTVLDNKFADEVFSRACYHNQTKKLILTDDRMVKVIPQFEFDFWIKMAQFKKEKKYEKR